MKNILIKPLITEKVAVLNEKGKYGFVVATRSNKVEIKKAIEKLYGVNVEEINTMICRGKTKSRQSKSGVLSGRTNSYKKAIVKVAEGEVIDIYSGI
ncbi:MAG TPA: 50S ribosomal protein L23 [Cytophagaceae bacterium]|jgi:large subunit ribosomal protein L23|nr:50S ribosomal protein L23 [Cytophagaceae bacterium]